MTRLSKSYKILIENTKAFVKAELNQAESGHDWFHTERVYNIALSIAKEEKVQTIIVALSALLHDIAEHKFHNGDETIGPKKRMHF